MGMDLLGKNADVSCRMAAWDECQVIAGWFGWIPKGTEPPDDFNGTDWDGRYHGNDYQYVTDADAKSMSDALYRALESLNYSPLIIKEDAIKTITSVRRTIQLIADLGRDGGFIIA